MPSWLRTILLAAVAGTVLGVGLGYLRTDVMPKTPEVMDVGAIEPLDVGRPITEKESGMPAYAGVQLKAFGDQTTIQGVPMSTGWFLAPDPIEEVQTFYERRLAEAGIPLVTKRYPNGLGYVGYREPGTDLMHTVTLMPEGQNATRVFVSTSSSVDVLAGMALAKVPEVLPHPPGAIHTAVMGAGVGPVGQQWVTATLPGQNLKETVEFYRKGFVERGWSVSETIMDVKQDGAWIQAAKPPLEARVSLKVDRIEASEPGLQLFVLLTDLSRQAASGKAVAN